MPNAARMGDPLAHSVSNRVKGLLIGMGIAAIGVGVFVLTGGLGFAAVAAAAVTPMTVTGALITGASIGASIGKFMERFKTNTGQIQSGSSDVFINNISASRVKLDTASCSHHPSTLRIATGSDSVFINNMPAARVGDKRLVCWAEISEGSPNVFIGGGTTVAPGNALVSDSLSKFCIWGVLIGTSALLYGAGNGLKLAYSFCSAPIKDVMKNMFKKPVDALGGIKKEISDIDKGIKETRVWADSL